MKNVLRTAFVLFMGAMVTACGKGFTPAEKEIIGKSGDGIMRLYVVDNPDDSLLLSSKAARLGSAEVSSPRFGVLKERMLATVNDPSNRGVGIAAPQVGISRRLVAVQRVDKEGEPFEFYINPEIVYYSEEKRTGTEGCLSIPERSGNVIRSTEIVIRYDGEDDLKEKVERISGFAAVIFQHEIDHLNGVLYTDRIKEQQESRATTEIL